MSYYNQFKELHKKSKSDPEYNKRYRDQKNRYKLYPELVDVDRDAFASYFSKYGKEDPTILEKELLEKLNYNYDKVSHEHNPPAPTYRSTELEKRYKEYPELIKIDDETILKYIPRFEREDNEMLEREMHKQMDDNYNKYFDDVVMPRLYEQQRVGKMVEDQARKEYLRDSRKIWERSRR